MTGVQTCALPISLQEQAKEYGSEWEKQFRKAYDPLTSESERENISADDSLTKIAQAWGATNSGQARLFEKIMKRERNNESWEVQASITTSPYCNSEYLDRIAKGIGRNVGYGYVLRTVCRNKNVSMDTLKRIAEDEAIESRYKQNAVAAVKYGREAANHQI